MNRICGWLADLASRMLETDERAAVLGDLAESREAGGRALRGVLGLVLRRRAALWKDWGPWVAPLGLIAPIALLGGWSGLRLIGWIGQKFVTFWNVGVRYENGMTVVDDIVRLVCSVLLVIAWTWSGGFVMGALSRRAVWAHPVLLLVLCWFSYLVVRVISAPQVAYAWMTIWTLLIPFPFLWGVWRGARSGAFGMGRAVWISIALAILTLAAQIEDARQKLAFQVWSSGGSLGGKLVWTPRLLPFVAILWQFGFLYAAVNWRCRRDASYNDAL